MSPEPRSPGPKLAAAGPIDWDEFKVDRAGRRAFAKGLVRL
jgi:hypothetical protein